MNEIERLEQELEVLQAVLEPDGIEEVGAPAETPLPLPQLLAAAVTRRAAGRPTGPWATHPLDPRDAFVHTLDELAALLDGIQPVDWAASLAPAYPTWQVGDLVAHLVAVERYHAALLGGAPWTPPPGTEFDHVGMTEPTIAELAGLGPAARRQEWQRAADESARLTRAEPDLTRRVEFCGLPLRVQNLLVTRVFEIWTHTDDIRRSVGRPVEAPDGDRLSLMSNLAVGALPLGLALAGRSRPGQAVRVVLTGPGGGAWTQSMSMGELPGEPEALVVADVVDFCRLAAKRLGAEEIDCVVEGDAALVADVLAGAAVFAS